MFQILALEKNQFEKYFEMDDVALKQNLAKREIVDEEISFPCRVSLEFANIGEEVILLNYSHLSQDSPFKSSYAIYVRKNATQVRLNPNELPAVFNRQSPIALRAFGNDGLLKTAVIAMPNELTQNINAMFENREIDFIHAHFAIHGCFAAKIVRA